MATEPGRPRNRGVPVLGPAILIAVGIIFFLNNLEIVPWGVWGSLWRFWPILLILLGINIILGRTKAGWGISVIVAVALVVFIVGVAVGASQAGWIPAISMESTGEPGAGSVDKELSRIQEARANIEFGAGRLSLDALPTSSDRLVVVDYRAGTLGRAPRLRLQEQDHVGVLRITGDEEVRFGRTTEPDLWDVHLSRSVPVELTVRIGAAEGNLDLTELKVQTLNLDIGASSAMVRFPTAAGSTRAFINTGAASLTLEIPPSVGARIVSESGLATVDSSPRFSRSGNIYTSENYQAASNRLDIELKAGVSSVNIK